MWSAELGSLALDLDGTLIDARRRQLAVLAGVLAEHELAPIPFDVFWERKRGGEPTAEALIAVGIDDAEAKAVTSRWVERIEEEDELSRDLFLPGVEENLANLAAAGVRPTVITARTHPDRARRQFASLRLDRWCDGPRVVGTANPEAAKAAVLRSLDSRAFIGDTESDALAASLSGVRFIAVETGQRSAAFLAGKGVETRPTLGAALGALTTRLSGAD
jgi:phosphoglycolate phosphatase-like HAD superfamily hydrolase